MKYCRSFQIIFLVVVLTGFEAAGGSPKNDQFGAAADLGASRTVLVEADLQNGSRQEGEPFHAGNSYSPTAWWSWTAPGDGMVYGELSASSIALAVYYGEKIESLVKVADNNRRSWFSFAAESGRTYRLVLAENDRVTFSFNYVDFSGSDNFANAVDLGVASDGSFSAGMGGLTIEPGEPELDDDFSKGGTAWWKWTAPQDGRLDLWLDQEGISGSWIAAIYVGTELGGLERRAFWEYHSDGRAAARVRAGETVYLQIAAHAADIEGILNARYRFDQTAGNHQDRDASSLGEATDVEFGGTVAGVSSLVSGEYLFIDQERWWTWTSPSSGHFGVRKVSGHERVDFRSYYVDDDGELALTHVSDRFGTHVPAGRIMLFRARLLSGAPRDAAATYRLRFFPGPLNNDLDEAIDLGSQLKGVLAGEGRYATSEPEFGESGGFSVWWKWTAPADGDFISYHLGDVAAALYRFDEGQLDWVTAADRGSYSRWRVVSGETYYLGFEGQAAFSADYEFKPFLIENDLFANAIDLGSEYPLEVTGDSTVAGRESGEPGALNATLWWKWTAPANGRLVVRESANGFSVRDEIYTGDSLENLIMVGSFAVNVVGGTAYYIVTGSTHQPGGGVTELDIRFTPDVAPPPPANDSFVHAEDLGSQTYVRLPYNLGGATIEAGEPELPADRNASIWWEWRAPYDGLLHLTSTFVSQLDLTVFVGSSLESLQRAGAAPGPVPVNSGEVYWIAATAFSSSGPVVSAPGLLHLFATPGLPAGSEFGSAIELPSDWQLSVEADRTGAAVELGEPEFSVFHHDVSMWWRWVAPEDGYVKFSSDWDINLFGGGNLEGLVEVDFGPRPFSSFYDVVGGTEYYVRAVGSGFESGNVWFNLSGQARPEEATNDDFAEAMDLGIEEWVQVRGSTFRSSIEEGESHEISRSPTESIWYRWTSPGNGRLTISEIEGEYAALKLYSGVSIEGLTELAPRSLSSREFVLAVRNGEQIHLAVVLDWFNAPGSVEFELKFDEGPPNDFLENAHDFGEVEVASFLSGVSGATIDGVEPDSVGGRGSLWWKWTAPGNGVVYINQQTSLQPIFGSTNIYLFDQNLVQVETTVDSSYSGYDGEKAVVNEGEVYFIAIAGSWYDETELRGFVSMVDPPDNDDFVDAEPLALGELVEETLFGATLEQGEPDHGVISNLRFSSRWWTWTSTETQDVWLNLRSSIGDAVVAVYTGGALDELTLVTTVPRYTTHRWTAETGVSYYFAVTGIGESDRDFTLRFDSVAVPANDDLQSPVDLGTSIGIPVSGNNAFATVGVDEPNHAGQEAIQSVWYSWEAPESGTFAINASASFRRMVVGIYQSGPLGELVEVASDRQAVGFSAQAGERFLIVVDKDGSPEAIPSDSRFEFVIERVAPSSNDDFAQREVIPGLFQPVTGNGLLATVESGEGDIINGAIRNTLWWEWRAPASGSVAIWFREGGASVYVYTASIEDPSLSDLQPQSTSYQFSVTAGKTYYFQVGVTTNRPAEGEFAMELRPISGNSLRSPNPVNDHFADRIFLGHHAPIAVAGNTAGATREDGEEWSPYGESVWWSWSPAVTGVYEIRPQNSAVREIVVGTGESMEEFDIVAEGRFGSVYFDAEVGVIYQIAVRGSNYGVYNPVGFEVLPRFEAPENDDFENRKALASDFVVTELGSTVSSTAQFEEPEHGGVAAEHSLWWTWVAPSSELFRFSVSSESMRLAVYEGHELQSLILVGQGAEAVEFEAREGTQYQLVVDSSIYQSFEFLLQPKALVLMPYNDDFSAAEQVDGSIVVRRGTTREATIETGERLHGLQSRLEGSVWWSWSAPQDGPVSIFVESDGAEQEIAVYTGSDLSGLVHVMDGEGEQARIYATAGVTYQIVVASRHLLSAGDFQLTIDQTISAPANDNFADAQVVEGSNLSVSGTTIGASIEQDEPPHHPRISSKDQGTHSVWFLWTCPEEGQYRLTHSMGLFARLGIYEGERLDSLSLIDFGDSGEVVSYYESGQQLYIAISQGKAPSDFTFSVERLRESNDDFADRVVLAPGELVAVGSTAGASREDQEPLHGGARNQGGSVWWSWTAQKSGEVALDFTESPEIPLVAVYTGSALENLVEVASGASELLEFEAVGGETYHISIVEPFHPTSNLEEVEMVIRVEPPENDDFTNRIQLPSSLSVAMFGSNIGATREDPEPGSLSSLINRSVWWEWNSPIDGTVDLTIGSVFQNSIVEIFSGGEFPDLSAVTSTSPEEGVLRFFAFSGRSYYIRLSSRSNQYMGTIDFEIDAARSVVVNDNYEGALWLSGDSGSAVANLFGATTEVGEPTPVSGLQGHGRSLWWRWQAPRDGAVRIVASGGSMFLYRGEWPLLVEADFVIGEPGVYVVESGVQYSLAVTSEVPGSIDFSWDLGPPEDLIDNREDLGSSYYTVRRGSLEGATREASEVFHVDSPPTRSIWYEWRAPIAGAVRLMAMGTSASFRMAVYTGTNFANLTPVATGLGQLSFDAEFDVRYLIAIDTDPDVQEDFDYEFRLSVPSSPYPSWRANFFAEEAPGGSPLDDPDGDGCVNLFEMAFGKNPLVFDPGEISFTVEERWGYIVLSVVRPIGVDGIRYSFEVSRTLDGDWEWTGVLDRIQWAENNGDGTETFRVLLSDFDPDEEPQFFARLRVDLGEDPLEP